MKKDPCEEVILDGDVELVFRADFSFMSAVNEHRDIALLYADMSEGDLNPNDIMVVLAASLKNSEISDKEEFSKSLLERYGIQECGFIAYTMVLHACVGSVKKEAMERREKFRSIIDQMQPFPLKNLKQAGLLWVGLFLTFTPLQCLIFSLLGRLGWL